VRRFEHLFVARMARFSSADVSLVAERLKRARDRSHPAHFLIGAGCSITAGIPSAKDLIAKIHQDYPEHCSRLADDKRHAYGACMGLLSPDERRYLIQPYMRAAKINWGTIALAQFIGEGFVERVLTVNFDLVLENACALLGLQPAVYDFGVAPADDPSMIVSPAIVHLHGQSYGLVLLNTEDETERHREKLHPILVYTLRDAPLVVIGYSGSADGISQTLLAEFIGRNPLYWASFSDELASHLLGFRGRNHFEFLGGADFDRFMIELAQALGCWPPHLISDPPGHLLMRLSPVVQYPTRGSDADVDALADLKRETKARARIARSEGTVDLLRNLRQKLGFWQSRMLEEERQRALLRGLYMKGEYEQAAALFARSQQVLISEEDVDLGYWAFLDWGNELFEKAEDAEGDEAALLLDTAAASYAKAHAVKPDGHEALKDWGNLLLKRATNVGGEEATRLRDDAARKYEEALVAKPNDPLLLNNLGVLLYVQAASATGAEAESLFVAADAKFGAAVATGIDVELALRNWITLLLDQAQRANGEAASRLFAAAGEKVAEALRIKPDDVDLMNQSGLVLFERAKRASGEEASRLFAAAGGKLAEALRVKPDEAVTLSNWGQLLAEQAKRTGGEEAVRLLLAAGDKYAKASALKPDDPSMLNEWGVQLSEQLERASDEEAFQLLAAAAEEFARASRLRPNDAGLLNEWGFVLDQRAERASGEEAARIRTEAQAKYEAGLAIAPNAEPILRNLGNLLIKQAKSAADGRREQLLASAVAKLGESAKLEPAETYDLACAFALRGDEERCRDNLENAERCDTLPDWSHLARDTDLDAMRDKPWFQELLARKKANAAS
jgi:hypothetical protein